MGVVRVGTSGWQYDHWKGRFYPDDVPKSRWFDYYVQRFPSVEINFSFYRLPRISTSKKWHDQAPNLFRYAAKASRYITHNLKLADAKEAIGNVMERFEPMKTYLAVVLWQLPPNLHRDVERLDAFLAQLPSGVRHAVEFRHPSWVDDEIFATLDRHRAAHVWVSSDRMPVNRTLTDGLCYVRFHGVDKAGYRYDYSRTDLEPWAAAVREVVETGCDAYVYFNNDYEANAPRNARTFIELLGGAALPWGNED
ncbi:MAG: DUF72 domain-containing protein [Actinomycetota bacterium]|nr:DUF72 domain-containing protein [Actinomycetota bacterium]